MRRTLSVDKSMHKLHDAEHLAYKVGNFASARTLVQEVLTDRVRTSRPDHIQSVELRGFRIASWLAHNDGKYSSAYKLATLSEKWGAESGWGIDRAAEIFLRRVQALGKLNTRRAMHLLTSWPALGHGDAGVEIQAEYYRRMAELQEDLVRSGEEPPHSYEDLISMHDSWVIPLLRRTDSYDLIGNSQDNSARFATQLIVSGWRWSVINVEARLQDAESNLLLTDNSNALYLHHLDAARFWLATRNLSEAKFAYNAAVALKIRFGLSAGPLSELRPALGPVLDEW